MYILLQNHANVECQMVEVQCPNNGCSKLVVKRNLTEHLRQCDYRMIKCQLCKQDIHYYQRKVKNILDCIAVTLFYYTLAGT